MALVKFSSEFVANNSVNIDNVFISEFMPFANENCVKVFLFGLLKCSQPDTVDNSLEGFSLVLKLSKDDIVSAFMYWEEVNLVKILSYDPLEIRYLPIKNGSMRLRKLNEDKYKAFNIKAQEVLAGRTITPVEFSEYYYFLEQYKMEQDALVMVMKYCTELKNNKVGYAYILTVARDWAKDGILTCEDVTRRLQEQDQAAGDIATVFKALKLNRTASADEYKLFLSWVHDWDFSLDTIVYLAKMVKGALGAMNKLNKLIEKCYASNIRSIKEISEFFKNQEKHFELAKIVCKRLGVRYDNLEAVVDTYIAQWLGMGFDEEAIGDLASYCFKTSVRTLQGMNKKVEQLHAQGLLTKAAMENHLQTQIKNDGEIERILHALGIERVVINSDRTAYKTWMLSWGTTEELLNYAIEQAADKYMPLQYLNKLLSNFHNSNVKTVAEAKNIKISSASSSATKEKQLKHNVDKKENYTKSQLDSLFVNVFEVEL